MTAIQNRPGPVPYPQLPVRHQGPSSQRTVSGTAAYVQRPAAHMRRPAPYQPYQPAPQWGGAPVWGNRARWTPATPLQSMSARSLDRPRLYTSIPLPVVGLLSLVIVTIAVAVARWAA